MLSFEERIKFVSVVCWIVQLAGLVVYVLFRLDFSVIPKQSMWMLVAVAGFAFCVQVFIQKRDTVWIIETLCGVAGPYLLVISFTHV